MKLFGKGRKNGEENLVGTVEELEVTTEVTEEVETELEPEFEEEITEEAELEYEEVSAESEEPEFEEEVYVETEESVEESDEPEFVEETEESEEESDEDETEESEEALLKKAKRKRRCKIALGIFTALILLVGGVYGAGVYYFTTHFFHNTTINGYDISLKEMPEVHQIFVDELASYELTVRGKEDVTDVITAQDVAVTYVESEDVAAALKLQDEYKWPEMFLKDSNFNMEVEVTFDEELLAGMFSEMSNTRLEDNVKPVNAYPEYSNGKVIIVEEVYGNSLVDGVEELMSIAINNLDTDLDLVAEQMYIAPEFVSDSKEVLAAVDTMHTYLNSSIKYSEGDVLSNSTIISWVSVDKDTMEVSLDSSKITSYVSTLSKKYNTSSSKVTFINPVGKEATVSGGSFGTKVNTSSEASQITADIKSGKTVSREIKYSSKESSTNKTDSFGDTYVCLDLTEQKVYMLYKGELVMTSDCVTGNVAAGNATPQGVYTLTYKTKNAVLRGTRYADGSYSYESPVSYWMPFNGGIGFHDASWRTTYGGTIYKTNGSHGCVNMPLANAKTLYSYINSSMPIVCHY